MYYFNTVLFRVALFNVPFFTIPLIMLYCLLAFSVSIFLQNYFQCCSFKCSFFRFYYAVLLFIYSFLDNFFFYVAPKEFLYQLVRLALIGIFAYFVNFNRFDLFKPNKLMARLQFWIPPFGFSTFDYLTNNAFREVNVL